MYVQEELLKQARAMATAIAQNSPRAVQGSKVCLNFAEDHSTSDSLNQVIDSNLQSLDQYNILSLRSGSEFQN